MTTAALPSGTVTFLFTDIEGSTRLWEEHPQQMRSALARHDEILRTVIDAHRGVVFSTGGDGVAAAFHRAADAVTAAIEAQRRLGAEQWPAALQLRVRIGAHTGEAQERDGDYFGPPLNRAARVMAAGHGGQILVGASTAALLDGVDLVDLGEHRLRDLSGVEHLFQVRAEGLDGMFAPLRTVDAAPGNLPVQLTSFVGRDVEVKELIELVRAHRLVTLTGVGGVGKTRLALQLAAQLTVEFPDGVWLVELAPVGDPGSVPDVVATTLRVTPSAGMSVTASVAQALSGRRLLLVLDNCEHVLDAAAELVESILERAATVKVVATSREGLRLGAEHLWPVPTLDVGGGSASNAVELFVARARAVKPGFSLQDDAVATAVTEICARLDGIALAIELAAARMVAMSAQDVRDRLGARFRLLSGPRRGPGRHQTFRDAVGWSYDLLGDDERTVLGRCSVFSGGFDLAAAAHVCGRDDWDEYVVLDVLDSLVRKSLVIAEQADGHARYGLLETIREFAEDRLSATTSIDAVRDRHARYFAAEAMTRWEMWEGPGHRRAVDWVQAELANLRAGFRWAADRSDLVTAAAIAAHTAMMGFLLNLFEPIGWAEEILPVADDVAQLPRLYTAAGQCGFLGRVEAGADYGRTALALAADGRYDPFHPAWTRYWAGNAELLATGDLGRFVDVLTDLAGEEGLSRAIGLVQLVYRLPGIGQTQDAREMAPQALTVANEWGNPLYIGMALYGAGRAFADTDPVRAIEAFRQAEATAREHHIPFMLTVIARDAAGLEALHGDRDRGLQVFDTTISSTHLAGNWLGLGAVLAGLAVFLDRAGQPEAAATTYGASTRHAHATAVMNLAAAVEHLREVLGTIEFDEHVAAGAAMEDGDAVAYARHQIRLARANDAGSG